MTLYNGADGSDPDFRPGTRVPAGTLIIGGYIGALDLAGQPDTPHIWDSGDWNMYLDPESPVYAGPDARVLPIFTHNFPGDPAVLAENATDAAADLGWKPGIGRLIAVDLETLIDPPYVAGLNLEIARRGFIMMKYGSFSTINQNPPVHGGTWAALWVRLKPRRLPPGTVGQQWRAGPAWDLDVFSEYVYDNCGRGLRRTAAAS